MEAAYRDKEQFYQISNIKCIENLLYYSEEWDILHFHFYNTIQYVNTILFCMHNKEVYKNNVLLEMAADIHKDG